MLLIKQEPVLLQGVVQAALALCTTFGLGLTSGQTAAILAFTAAILSLVTRRIVTPTVNPRKDDGTPLIPWPAG